jgi:hypothetical protein
MLLPLLRSSGDLGEAGEADKLGEEDEEVNAPFGLGGV